MLCAGKDSEKTFDRFKSEKKILGSQAEKIDFKTKIHIKIYGKNT